MVVVVGGGGGVCEGWGRLASFLHPLTFSRAIDF